MLVVIGLLVGGVLVGQSLLQQTRLLKVTTDIRKFVTAVQTFQQQYNALPGDMPNATQYWGAAGTPTNASACYTTVGTGTQTCDGNGDGQIYLVAGYYAEQYRAWQHLQLAGLIEGSYNGINEGNTPGNVLCLPGTNCPKGQWSGSGYEIAYMGNRAAYTPISSYGWAPLNYGHVIMFGSQPCAVGGNCWPQYPVISASEQASLDTKYDDGLPFSGIISVGHVGYDPNCATTPYTAASTYNLSYSGTACSMVYVTGF